MKPMQHQLKSIALMDKSPVVFDMSDPGCVSADTEFLTPTGWKRIDQYTQGDLVAQFYPAEREIEFVKPLAYVKRPCERMIAIAPVRGTSQRLSHEHRVLYYNADGTHGICSAKEYMNDLHRGGPNHLKRKFCSTFSVRNRPGLTLSDQELRVMVAVIADGHFGDTSKRCTVRLKKPRKIERLRRLLADAGIQFTERTCGGQPDFRVFRFDAPWREKVFGPTWWQADQHQLEVIADELPHWDSSKRKAGAATFSSFMEESANFAQYAFSAAKQPASFALSYRNRKAEGRGTMAEYVVHARAEDCLVGPGRKDSVFEIANPEGFKYCFEVPTSFLLLRHLGYIFATGNTGKTGSQIFAFAKRHKRDGKAMLVIAPKTILNSAWEDDVKKFAPHLRTSVARAEKREQAFAVKADVYITNTDAVKWLVKQKKAFFDRFSTIVVDEVSTFKHHTSQRSKALNKIKTYFKHRAALSGTPNSNTICDIWNPAYFLDDGQRLGPSFYGFRSSVCVPKQVGRDPNAIEWVDKDGAEEAVFGLLADITIRHEFDKCVDIPPTHNYSMAYHLPPKQLKAYQEMEKMQIALLAPSKGKEVQVVSAINAAAVTTKLLQIASGAVYENPEKYHVVDTGRYEMTLDLCAEREHPLVFFLWKHQRDQMIAEAEARHMKYAVIDGDTSAAERQAIMTSYQRGLFDVVFAHPKSAAHGLTMTAGNSIIWPSPTYDLEWWSQGNKRQARIGQKKKTEVICLLAPGTIETKVYDKLMAKSMRMNNLLDLFALEAA